MNKYLLYVILAFGLILTACQKEARDLGARQDLPAEHSLKAGQSGMHYTVHLAGSAEVPPAMTNATGEAIFHLKNDGTEIHYKLIVANIENVMAAHIHMAPEGQNGPVVAWLYPAAPPSVLIPGRFNGLLATGVLTSANLVGPLVGMDLQALIDLMQSGMAYVNVHTQQYPGGEIRGQF